MPDHLPSPITFVEPAVDAKPASAPVDAATREAARRVLARDGRDVQLQPWQVAWLLATSEGREAVVPPGCGIGRGWLQARLDEERAAG